jgi:ABC-2 type transport system ATP-binding protein
VVEHVDVNGSEVTAAVTNGPAAVSPVALALAEAGGGLRVRELSLRTPTLDDVFLSVTGARIADRDGDTDPARKVEEAR